MINEYLTLVRPLIRFKSVSTDPTYKDDVAEAAEYLCALFESRGFNVRKLTCNVNPLVRAEYHVSNDVPTCLIYGHYDVQPAEEEDWQSEPFELTERDHHLYARGVVDNKGQFMIHVAAIFKLIEEGKLRYNVIFLIEGDEETGSAHLRSVITENQDCLGCDFCMISDSEVVGMTPVIEIGCRGTFNATLTLRTSEHDLHSGIFGGSVPNAAHEVSHLVSLLHDKDFRLTIPGIYDGVHPVHTDRAEGAQDMTELTGTKRTTMPDTPDFYTQTGFFPTIEVTCLKSGYVGEGYRNSIPATACAKFNVRLGPQQDVQAAIKGFDEFIKAHVPDYVSCELEIEEFCQGVLLDTENPYAQKAQHVLKEVYELPAMLKPCGGSLPITTEFAEILNIPQLLVPFANSDNRMHAANENFNLEHVKKGLEFSYQFFGS